MELLHAFDVKRLQSTGTMTESMTYESFVGLPVARRGDEVETTLNSRVLDQLPTYARLRVQVVLELGIHVVDYRLPAEEDKPPDRRDFLSQLFRSKDRSYQCPLFTTSPNPGVSTIVRRNRTPPSFISTVDA